MLAEIIIEKKTKNSFFIYRIPKQYQQIVSVGSIVWISFGNQKIRGIVVKIIRENDNNKIFKYQLKDILSLEKFVIDPIYLKVIYWISDYYLCSLSEAACLFLPPKISRPRKRKSNHQKRFQNKLLKLNQEQQIVFNQLISNLNSETKKPSLIFGVTGSGKTEIYLRLVQEMLGKNKSVVLLVPEIVLTPQNISRFESYFLDQVVIMHSKLSQSERYYNYEDFYFGRKKIIIGARSALLVPNKNIGLIIIDEEQEESYKQERNPRYEAVNLANEIVKQLNCGLVLGSATPKIETFYQTEKKKFQLLKLTKRFHQPELPATTIVDMKNEIKRGNNSIISSYLHERMSIVLSRNGQIILFLNRRGMATFVSCRDCGEVIFCSHCDVPMIYHLGEESHYLHCHHCDKKQKIPEKCPNCGSLKIKFFGSGTEKIEKEVKDLFPLASIKRIDSKTFNNLRDYEKFYQDFSLHRFDIVIGTQILAKGFDIPGVELVGIISADVGLHLPHFRASEKVFKLITQVSGRSGRRERRGETIIQTYWPDSEAIRYAAKHDYIGFYEAEIKKRFKKNYPPKNHIIRVLSVDKIETKAKTKIQALANELKNNQIEFIGPGKCFFSKINDRFRYQLIIKINKMPNNTIKQIYNRYQEFIWDVDPNNLL